MSVRILIVALLVATFSIPFAHAGGRRAGDLPARDAQQITRLVAKRPELGTTIRKLEMVGRDRVRVEVGRSLGPRGWIGSTFFVVRRGTIWIIDEQSIEAVTERTITVD